jgi:hypothetical protein
MKIKAAFIVPVLFMLIGVYALLTVFSSSGEQVALISDQAVPRGLALMFGAIGIGGGLLILFSMLTGKKPVAEDGSRLS